MRFLDKKPEQYSENMIVLEHKGVELLWNIKTYRNLLVSPELVMDINNYWASLSAEVQDKMFEIYCEIYELFEYTESTRVLDKELLRLVADLYNEMDFDEVMEYMYKSSNVKLPTNLKDDYQKGDTRELTYLKHEYYELLGLCIILKPMIPIWGMYINAVVQEVGTNFKEYRSARLLRNTKIVESRGYKRLFSYVSEYWIGETNKQLSAAILAGLDEDQVPSWLMGNVLIRRVSASPLFQRSMPGDPPIIITTIYNYIESLCNTMDKLFGGRVNEKGLRETSGSDEDNTSVAENYKIKQEISEGIVVMHDVYLIKHRHHILQLLDKSCPVKELEKNVALFNKNYSGKFEFSRLALRLVQWTLHPVVNARSLEYVSYNALINSFHIAYTLLKHWGYESIAMFLYAQPEYIHTLSNGVKQQVTEQQLEELMKIYPHFPNSTLKRKVTKRDQNVAVVAISKVVSYHFGSWWRIPQWDVENISLKYPEFRITSDGVLALPVDMEQRIADLVIFLKTKIHNQTEVIEHVRSINKDITNQ